MYVFQNFLKTKSSENDQFFIDAISFFREILFNSCNVIQFDSFTSVFYLKKNSTDKFVPVLKDFKREYIVQNVLLKDFSYLNNFKNFIDNKYSLQSFIFEEVLSNIEKHYALNLKETNIKHLSFHRALARTFRTNKLPRILFLKPYFLEHFNQDTGKFKQRNIEFFSSKIHYFNFSYYKSYISFKMNKTLHIKKLILLLDPLIKQYPSKADLILHLFNSFYQKFVDLTRLIMHNSNTLFKNIMLKNLINIGLSKSYRIEFETKIMFFCSSNKLKYSLNCPTLYKTDTMYKHFFQIQSLSSFNYSSANKNPLYFYKSFNPLKVDINLLSFNPIQVNHILDYVASNTRITNYLLFFLSKNYMNSFSLEDLKKLSEKDLFYFYLQEEYRFSFESVSLADDNLIFSKNFSKLNHIKCHSIQETILFSYLNTISYLPLRMFIPLLEKFKKRDYIIILHIFVHLIKSYLSIEVIRKNHIPSYHLLSENLLSFLRFQDQVLFYSSKELLIHFKAIKKISNFNSKLEYFSNF